MQAHSGSSPSPDEGNGKGESKKNLEGSDTGEEPFLFFGSPNNFRFRVAEALHPALAALPPAMQEELEPRFRAALDGVVSTLSQFGDDITDIIWKMDNERLTYALTGDTLPKLFAEESDISRISSLTMQSLRLILGKNCEFGAAAFLSGESLKTYLLDIDPDFDTALCGTEGQVCFFNGSGLFKNDEAVFDALELMFGQVCLGLKEPAIFQGRPIVEQLDSAGVEDLKAADRKALHKNAVAIFPITFNGEAEGGLMVVAPLRLVCAKENLPFFAELTGAISAGLAKVKFLRECEQPR